MNTTSSLLHPDVHRPFSQWSEDQTLHLVAAYINPFRWRTRRELFNDMRRHIQASPNVRFHAIEVAYGDRPFEVTDPSNPDDIQLRTSDEMWHKENAINIAVSRFPTNWRYGAYLDGDFHMTRYDWALETIHLLQHYAFVQLFSSYSDLSAETATSWTGHQVERSSTSYAWNYQHPEQFKKLRQRTPPYADTYYAPLPKTKEFPFGLAPGATGGGWAWTKSAFNAVGGMLDTCMLGSGDWHMAFGLTQSINVAAEMSRCTEPYVNKVLDWQARAAKLERNIGCLDNYAVHFYHGTKVNRAYGERWLILKKHNFDPDRDMCRDWQMLYKWNGKPELRDDIRRHFLSRNEDAS